MNGKQLGILLGLVIVIGGGGLLIYKKQGSSWGTSDASGHKLLGEFQINDVSKITVKHGTNELNLVKKNDLWCVRERNDYPANFGDISKLLIKLRDLKSAQTEQVGASQLGRLELNPSSTGSNAATLVELQDGGGKVIKSLLLGKKHMSKPSRQSQFGDMDNEGWPDGRYVMTDTGSDKVHLISDVLSEIEPKPENWLSKEFFKIEKVRSIAVTFADATNSWRLTRDSETSEWKLADAKPAEKLDTSKTTSLSNPLSSPSFNDVISGLTPNQTGLDQPTLASLSTFDGLEYTIAIGTKTNEDYFLTVALDGSFSKERKPGSEEKPEDKSRLDKEFAESLKKLEDKLAAEKTFGKWIYRVSSWTVDSILKKRGELLEDKKIETTTDSSSIPKPEDTPSAQ